jgi:NADH dehydrogenase
VRQHRLHLGRGEARAVELAARPVRLAAGALRYDYLVLGPGSSAPYFGHDEWARLAPGLKSIDDALAVRRRILLAYEAAERETEVEKPQNSAIGHENP